MPDVSAIFSCSEIFLDHLDREEVHMGHLHTRTIVGLVLIFIGLALLGDKLDLFQIREEFLIAGVLAVAGLAFLYTGLEEKRKNRIFSGAVLLFISALFVLVELDILDSDYIGPVFLWTPGALFLAAYASNHEKNWWAIIPGGILLTVGTAAFLDIGWWFDDDWVPVVIMGGFSLTFAAVYFARAAAGQTASWALFVSFIFALICMIVISEQLDLDDFILPVVFITVGLYLIARGYRAQRENSTELPEVESHPQE